MARVGTSVALEISAERAPTNVTSEDLPVFEAAWSICHT
jgi:hypothetical protein